MQTLQLKPKEHRRLMRGHCWVFSNEVAQHPDSAAAGDLVRVVAASGAELGTALYHPGSLIAARMLGPGTIEADAPFFQERLGTAKRLRERLFPQDTAYRLVHGESDALPGLIVDRYGDCLCVETLSAGMDRRLDTICDVLEAEFHPASIVERNDSPLRGYEDLPQRRGLLRGGLSSPVEVRENGLRYLVDPMQGQKTGFFLDQKNNRRAVARYCRGAVVLDAYCNAGGFAVSAAAAGASQVLGVDTSEAALASARENARLNGVAEICGFRRRDAVEFMDEAIRRGDRFDVIVLDPPSFTRSKKNVPQAKRAYRRINEMACELLAEGGIVATASCSFHIFEDVFYQIVDEAAQRAGRRLRLLERRFQSPDHPILLAMPETLYLKFGILQVL